jgi:hypothetical protein
MRLLVVSYQRFETTYRSHYQGSGQSSSRAALPLKMGSIGYSETSDTNYQSTLGNIPEETLHRGKAEITHNIVLLYWEEVCSTVRTGVLSEFTRCTNRKVVGASQVTCTVTEGYKVKRVAHYMHMEFAYSKICFILFSRVLFVRFFPVSHSLITLSTVQNKVSISESYSLIDKSR